MKYLVTGSRSWNDWSTVARFVELLRPGDQVAHGDAPGADSMVHWMLTNPRASKRRARKVYVYGEDGTIGQRPEGMRRGDVDVNVFPANWQRYRPADPTHRNPAGLIRNRWMVRTFKPDVVVYFRALGPSPGTDNCLDVCRELGVEAIYSIEQFIEQHAAYAAEEDE